MKVILWVIGISLWASLVAAQVPTRQVLMQDGVSATGAGTAMNVASFSTVALQVTISDTATVTFQGTVDGSTWASISCVGSTSTARAQTTSSTGLFQCNVAGLLAVRANVTSYSSGTITVSAVGSGAVFASSAGSVGSSISNGGGSVSVDSSGNVTVTVPSGGRLSIANASEATGSINYQITREVHTLAAAAQSSTTLSPSLASGDLLLGCSFTVNTAVTTSSATNTWDADFITGSTTALCAAGQAGTVDTKCDTLIVPEVATDTVEVEFDAPGAETFTGGVIETQCYYQDLTSLGDA